MLWPHVFWQRLEPGVEVPIVLRPVPRGHFGVVYLTGLGILAFESIERRRSLDATDAQAAYAELWARAAGHEKLLQIATFLGRFWVCTRSVPRTTKKSTSRNKLRRRQSHSQMARVFQEYSGLACHRKPPRSRPVYSRPCWMATSRVFQVTGKRVVQGPFSRAPFRRIDRNFSA